MSYDLLVSTLKEVFTNRVQPKIDYRHGLLGDGNGRVTVEGQDDFSYVRPDRFSGRAFKIFNKAVTGQDGDPIIIGELPWQPGLVQVIAFDWKTYSEAPGGWGNFAGVAKHGETHQWIDGAAGNDTFNVFRRQLGDLKLYDVSGSSSMLARVSPYSFIHEGTRYAWDNTQQLDLSPLVPTGSMARVSLAYWDVAGGTIGIATGTAGTNQGTDADNFAVHPKPTNPPGTIPSGYIITNSGQTSLSEAKFREARPEFVVMPFWATGTALGWDAADIPILNEGGLYTGISTVEAALDQVRASVPLLDTLVPFRVAGASGTAGNSMQPTIEDDVLVSDNVQHLGNMLVGGSIGNTPAAKLEVRGGAVRVSKSSTHHVIVKPVNSASFPRAAMAGGNSESDNNFLMMIGSAYSTTGAAVTSGFQINTSYDLDGESYRSNNSGLLFLVDKTTGVAQIYTFSGSSGAGGDIKFTRNNGNVILYLDESAQSVSIGTSTVGEAKLLIDQNGAAAAIPTLKLNQSDDSEAFFHFDSNIGSVQPINTAALGTYYGKIRVYVEGVGFKVIPLYNS